MPRGQPVSVISEYLCRIACLSEANKYSQSVSQWLGSRVVSVLDSAAEGPGSNRSRDAVG